jgi:CheY-like chemotaxis protein
MARLRVLVVDDEPSIHTIIRRILGEELEIVDKMSGEEAVADLNNDFSSFDVVLLDVRMPGVPDGVDLFRQLTQTNGPAVIFMTGDPHIAKALPMKTRTLCLAKPFTGPALRAAMAQVLAVGRDDASANDVSEDDD